LFFFQADPSYLNAVVGLEPNKSKHEFYIDVAPDFGFPLAMRPRFQLNAALFKFSKWAPTSK
jgi:scavenger receptor class B protein 1